jgi:two-component system response regulator NreC
MATRILIADDHGLMRAGLRAVLEDDESFEVVGETSTGEEALEVVDKLLPDIVLLDIGLPGIDGIEATRRLKKDFSQVQVLILTVYEDQALLRAAIRAGASGYIVKRAAGEELIEAVRAVSRGYMYIHPSVTRMLVGDLSNEADSNKVALESLTPRELEVMGYIIRGYSNREIAGELFISVRTVESHRASLFGKLALKNRAELVEFARKYGLKD